MAKARLLDVVRDRIRVKHYSYRTENSYLATERKVAASIQNQALAAIIFLYRGALKIDLPWLGGIVRAKRPKGPLHHAARAFGRLDEDDLRPRHPAGRPRRAQPAGLKAQRRQSGFLIGASSM